MAVFKSEENLNSYNRESPSTSPGGHLETNFPCQYNARSISPLSIASQHERPKLVARSVFEFKNLPPFN